MSGYRGLTIRGDSHSCPLCFGLDTYYNCVYDCAYCCFLGLNQVWGRDHRVLDVEWFKRRMISGLQYPNPQTPIGRAIRDRKTLRLGNKYDPLPPQEKAAGVTREVLEFLAWLDWEVKLETKNSQLLIDYADLLVEMKAVVTCTVTVGLEDDWSLLEGERTASPQHRLETLAWLQAEGLQVAVVSEPFIPGYHTLDQFKEFLSRLRAHGIRRLNIYNLRLTPFVVRRLLEQGLDVEQIWDENQDGMWDKLLPQLLEAAEDFIVGCPDFVNSGAFVSQANTCCGVDVQNPCTFNIINWKRKALENGGLALDEFNATWDGVGSYVEGLRLFTGKTDDYYTLKDTGLFEREGLGWKRI